MFSGPLTRHGGYIIEDPEKESDKYVVNHFNISYFQAVIAYLGLSGKEEQRRYFLALDSIISLLARCLSPIIFTHTLNGFSLFCLNYVDDKIMTPFLKCGVWMWCQLVLCVRRYQMRVRTGHVPVRQTSVEQ